MSRLKVCLPRLFAAFWLARDEQRGGTNALLAEHGAHRAKAALVAALVGHFQSEPVS